MIIGKFTQDGETYSGSIYAIGLGLRHVTFSPVPKVGNGPDFAVAGNPDGLGEFLVGAAWSKTSKKGRGYLSVKLDSPALAQPINCALTEQDGSYVLVWNRSEAKADEQSEAA